MLNDDKTEFLIIGMERQLSVDKIKISQGEVSPVSSVRNLGAWFDSHLVMSTHVTEACASVFYYRTISDTLGSICLVIPLSGLFTRSLQAGLITVMVYCTVLLSIKLRNFRVMNARARLVYRLPKYCHITPLLRDLHWLPVRLHVDFKLLLLLRM